MYAKKEEAVRLAALARTADSEVRCGVCKLSTPDADWCLGNSKERCASMLDVGLGGLEGVRGCVTEL